MFFENYLSCQDYKENIYLYMYIKQVKRSISELMHNYGQRKEQKIHLYKINSNFKFNNQIQYHQ